MEHHLIYLRFLRVATILNLSCCVEVDGGTVKRIQLEYPVFRNIDR